MRLIYARIGEVVRVMSLGGRGLSRKLLDMGVYPDDRVRVLRSAPLGGPLLIEIAGRELAIGRGIAARIEVEAEGE
jgi:ferrous iron transport protein A